MGISSDLRTAMLQHLEDESPYREILEEIDNAPLSAQEAKRGVETYRLKHHSLVIHRPDFLDDEPYWKFVVPDNKEVKTKLLRELHNVPSVGHPGFNRTLQLVKRHLYWRGMTSEVRDYVLQCPVCQLEKGEHQLPRGELQPLQVPQEKWTDVSIDFIVKLPKTKKGNDSVFVVVDRATKYAHFIPCTESMSARQTALLYWRHVARLHGIPRVLYSDRDVRFTSRFWRELWYFVGTSLRMSTSFHPQTQGQVERMNSVFEQVMRCTVHELGEPRNWDDLVPFIEFSVNSQPNRSTGYSPFYLTYGYHPVTPIDLLKSTDHSRVEAVDEFTQRLRDTYSKACTNLQHANEKYKQHYDRRHRPATYSVGQSVLLSTRHLRLQGTPQKLQRRFIGPFVIEERVGQQAYRLHLPGDWHIHPVFNVTLLRPWKVGDWLRATTAPMPQLEKTPDDDEHEIERLLRGRWVNRGNRRIREFLILWKGLGLDDARWVPETDITPPSHRRMLIDRDRPVFEGDNE